MHSIAWASSIPACAVLLIFVSFGDNLLVTYFGEDFRPAYYPLIIISVGQLVNALTGSVGTFLVMTGNEYFMAKVSVSVLCLNVVLSALLSAYFGMEGAAWATSASIVILNFTLARGARRLTTIRTTVL
jgi:O-antigen/teichoic acid export membrane protein